MVSGEKRLKPHLNNGEAGVSVITPVIMLAVLFWYITAEKKGHFRHPVIFIALVISIVLVYFTPPLYVTGSIDAVRICSIAWTHFLIMEFLEVLFVIGWLRTCVFEKVGACEGARLGRIESWLVVGLAALWMIGSVACVRMMPHYYSATSAVYDLVNGNAQTFRAERVQRLEILNDETIDDVVLSELTCKPSLLFREDIYHNKEEWLNTAVARYYDKNSVALGKSEVGQRAQTGKQ